jgi:hypothetical protein
MKLCSVEGCDQHHRYLPATDELDLPVNGEQWQPIPAFEREYEVSDRGRVRSLARVVTRRDGKRLPVRTRILGPQPPATS